MPGLPEVTLVGTMVADPSLRFTPSGDPVANFTVAANDRRYDREQGKYVDKGATFLRCSCWRQMAENVAESLAKGQRVMITGQLRQRDYETRDGEKRTTMDLDVSEVGPSLRFAIARSEKAGRSSGPPSDDPWTASSGGGTPSDDEPPF